MAPEHGAADQARPALSFLRQVFFFSRGQKVISGLASFFWHSVRFLIKPKAGATKVGFDVAHLAISSIPSMSVKAFGNLTVGQESKVSPFFLSLRNSTQPPFCRL